MRRRGAVGDEKLSRLTPLAEWLEAAEERLLGWKCVGRSLAAHEREELELWLEMVSEPLGQDPQEAAAAARLRTPLTTVLVRCPANPREVSGASACF